MRDRGQNQDVISEFYGKVKTIPEFMKQRVAGSGSWNTWPVNFSFQYRFRDICALWNCYENHWAEDPGEILHILLIWKQFRIHKKWQLCHNFSGIVRDMHKRDQFDVCCEYVTRGDINNLPLFFINHRCRQYWVRRGNFRHSSHVLEVRIFNFCQYDTGNFASHSGCATWIVYHNSKGVTFSYSFVHTLTIFKKFARQENVETL